jgi:hypothetical protein
LTGVAEEDEENPQESQLLVEEAVVDEEAEAEEDWLVIPVVCVRRVIGMCVPAGVTPVKEVRKDLVRAEFCADQQWQEKTR